MGVFSALGHAIQELRESGYEGPVTDKGEAVMTRTDRHGKPLPLFEGGTGHKTPDEEKANSLFKWLGDTMRIGESKLVHNLDNEKIVIRDESTNVEIEFTIEEYLAMLDDGYGVVDLGTLNARYEAGEANESPLFLDGGKEAIKLNDSIASD